MDYNERTLREKGVGFSYQRAQPDLYSIGIPLYYAKHYNFLGIYAQITPQFFVYGNRKGYNISPELGISKIFNYRHFYLKANLGYGYHLGIASANDYDIERHDISLKIGIGTKVKYTYKD